MWAGSFGSHDDSQQGHCPVCVCVCVCVCVHMHMCMCDTTHYVHTQSQSNPVCLLLTFQAAGSPRPQEIVFPPVLAPELMPFPFLARHMTARLEDYMRVVEQRRLAQINRGATQDTIERCTFPHKYKQVGRVRSH